MSFGSDESGGGYNRQSREYSKNPSLETYLKLRTEQPTAEIEISTLGGIDALFAMQSELKKHGFDPDIIVKTFDADLQAISEVSLLIMSKLVERKKLESEGENQLISRGKAVPDKLIDWLICVMLDALSWTDNLEIPRGLIVLLQHRLGGLSSTYRQLVSTHSLRRNALWFAAQIIARGNEPTLKDIAELLNVAPSTVTRWFSAGEFKEEADVLAKNFDSEGNFIGLSLGGKK